MNPNRRKFIKQVSLASAIMLVSPSFSCMAQSKKEIGLQLYSLREYFATDGVENVLKKVANAGYTMVEPYGFSLEKGYWGLTALEFKKLLDKYKLKCHSAHMDFGAWEQSQDESILEAYVQSAKTLHQQYIIVPYINPEIFNKEETVKAFAQKLTKAAKYVKSKGLKFAYHNHAFEFTKLENGKTGFEVLLETIDPSLIDFELDLYWVVRAEQNYSELFKNHSGRFKLWHIKDMSKFDTKKNTEIGNGSINYVDILKHAKVAGLEYAFVEQENFDIDGYESIAKSNKYLKEIM